MRRVYHAGLPPGALAAVPMGERHPACVRLAQGGTREPCSVPYASRRSGGFLRGCVAHSPARARGLGGEAEAEERAGIRASPPQAKRAPTPLVRLRGSQVAGWGWGGGGGGRAGL